VKSPVVKPMLALQPVCALSCYQLDECLTSCEDKVGNCEDGMHHYIHRLTCCRKEGGGGAPKEGGGGGEHPSTSPIFTI
jgi:hypothetical protein